MRIKTGLVLAACAAGLIAASPASATPVGSAGQSTKAAQVSGAMVDQVRHWRGRYYGHRRYAYRSWRHRYYGYSGYPAPYGFYRPYYSPYAFYRPYRFYRRPAFGIYLSF